MPHVVLKGEADIPRLGEAFDPFLERSGDTILKTTRVWTAGDGRSLLLEALSIEDGVQRPFFALVDEREDGLVVRLHPTFEVEKTDGVKQLLASIAKRLMKLEFGLSVGETNLQSYLETPQED